MTPDEFDDLARRLKLRPSTLKKAKLSTQSTPDEVRIFLHDREGNLESRMNRLQGYTAAVKNELARMESETNE